LVARKEEKMDELAKELKAKNQNLDVLIQRCDISNIQETERMLEYVLQKTSIDVLVNNAGLGDFAFFDKSKWERNHHMIQVNIVGLTFLTHKLVPFMVARGKGGIINVGSGASSITIPCAAVYSGTKHYINGLSESLNVDLVGTGVSVTQVCPGPVSTEGLGMKHLTSSEGASIVRITPKQCAYESIRAFDSGQSKVYPGFLFRWAMFFYSFVPTFMSRLACKVASYGFRAEERRMLERKPRNQ